MKKIDVNLLKCNTWKDMQILIKQNFILSRYDEDKLL